MATNRKPMKKYPGIDWVVLSETPREGLAKIRSVLERKYNPFLNEDRYILGDYFMKEGDREKKTTRIPVLHGSDQGTLRNVGDIAVQYKGPDVDNSTGEPFPANKYLVYFNIIRSHDPTSGYKHRDDLLEILEKEEIR